MSLFFVLINWVYTHTQEINIILKGCVALHHNVIYLKFEEKKLFLKIF